MMSTPKVVAIDQSDSVYQKFLENILGGYKIEFVPFKDLVLNFENRKFRTDIDMLLFTGGEDVSPELYGETRGSHTFINPERDQLAQNVADVYSNLPKLGICRGSQFLTVLSGGKLIQHVENHAGAAHACSVIVPGRNGTYTMNVTSTHHQMLFPYNMNADCYQLLGWSTKHRSNVYLDGKDRQMKIPTDFLEPEIVYYPYTKALAIQGHPEFDRASSDFKSITSKLVKHYLCQKY